MLISTSTLSIISTTGNGFLNVTTTRCARGLQWSAGQHVRVCQKNNKWSGDEATCIPTVGNVQEEMCAEHNTTDPKGFFTWSSASVGVIRSVVCPTIVPDEPVNIAFRRCTSASGRVYWEEPVTAGCLFASPLTREFHRVVQSLEERKISAQEVLDTIAESVTLLAEDTNITLVDAKKVIQILDVLIPQLDTHLSTVATDPNITNGQLVLLTALCDALAQFLDLNLGGGADAGEVAARLRANILRLAQSLPVLLPGESKVLRTTRLAMAGLCPAEGASYDFSFANGTTLHATVGLTSNSMSHSAASHGQGFTLPYEAVDIVATLPVKSRPKLSCRLPGIAFIAYTKSASFPGNQTIVSMAITAHVGRGEGSVQLNASRVNMTLGFDTKALEGNQSLHCVFWHEGQRIWKRDGCFLVDVTTSNDSRAATATCQCNHLTSFALLASPPDTHKSQTVGPHAKILSVISYIGCSLSLAGLLAVIASILTNKQMRNNLQTQLTLCTAVPLSLALFLFVGGTVSLQHRLICQGTAIALHYSLLVTFAFMGSIGLYLYKRLVVIFGELSETFLRNTVLTCLILPAAVVAASVLSVGLDTYSQPSALCFISSKTIFFGSFIAPMALMVLFNTVVAIRSLINVGIAQGVRSDRKTSRIMFKLLLIFTFLVGLTWVIGGLLSLVDSVLLQYAFTLLNSFQGFAIFLLHFSAANANNRKANVSQNQTTDMSMSASRVSTSPTQSLQKPLTVLQSSDFTRPNQVSQTPVVSQPPNVRARSGSQVSWVHTVPHSQSSATLCQVGNPFSTPGFTFTEAEDSVCKGNSGASRGSLAALYTNRASTSSDVGNSEAENFPATPQKSVRDMLVSDELLETIDLTDASSSGEIENPMWTAHLSTFV